MKNTLGRVASPSVFLTGTPAAAILTAHMSVKSALRMMKRSAFSVEVTSPVKG